ncbi:MAG: GNAT family N-acetyltransferase [Candidatus Omnitrophica bacterium]|nr:GNAT family N-acetyltransferase [Candidatus Omnitrophota bacterium]
MFTIRKFTTDDTEQVRSLIASVMANEFPEQAKSYPLTDLDDIVKTYCNIGEAFFVGCFGDEIIGTVAVKKEDERSALIRRIFVKPEFRNRRYGLRLLEEAINFCSVVGYQEIIFKTTSNMEKAIQLCLKKGFVEKARVDIGGIELLKFALFLKQNSPLA